MQDWFDHRDGPPIYVVTFNYTDPPQLSTWIVIKTGKKYYTCMSRHGARCHFTTRLLKSGGHGNSRITGLPTRGELLIRGFTETDSARAFAKELWDKQVAKREAERLRKKRRRIRRKKQREREAAQGVKAK